MTAPCQRACSPWATAADLSRLRPRCADLDPEVADEYLAIATDILFELSGERFPGSCLTTIRPCGDCGCSSQSACSCLPSATLRLPIEPATSVTEVMQDGAILDDSAYKLFDWRFLVRLDGTPWPRWQRLDLATTEVGTFRLSFTYGVLPPPPGVLAASALACEFALAQTGDTSCALPPRTRSLTRAGISMDLVDLEELRSDMTGIREVDLFLRAYNPYGSHRPAAIASPDIGPYAHTET